METIALSEMVRQRNATLAEAARLSVHAPERALGLLPTIEDENPAVRHARMAKDFAAFSPATRADALLLTGSHEARRDINARVRAELGLAGLGEPVRVFRALDRTVAEKRRLETYQPGLTIRFEKDYRSLSAHRGDTAQVERVLSDGLTLRLSDHSRRTMSLRKLSGRGWSVGVAEDLEVALGERVRFIGTDPRMGYRNGERGIVEELSAEGLLVRRMDGSSLQLSREQALSLDYAYAVTGHSAQGLDASRVILEKDTHSPTTNHRSFYTDLTRARDAAVVVTDSIARLGRRMRPRSTKAAALDAVDSSIARERELAIT